MSDSSTSRTIFSDVPTSVLGQLCRRHQNPDGSRGGWVALSAHVAPTVFLGPRVKVFDTASVTGNARVQGHVRIFENARVGEQADLAGDVWVSGNARIRSDAKVRGSVWVAGEVWLLQGVEIGGYGKIDGVGEIFASVEGTSSDPRLPGLAIVGDIRVVGFS